MKYNIHNYFEELKQIIDLLPRSPIEKMIDILKTIEGRLFILGVGGSATNASHAVNDFRRIAGIEAYTPADNIADITAVTNDYGWEYTFVKWLETVKLNSKDIVLVLSVGGGSIDNTISQNIVKALEYTKKRKAKIFGIISRTGGYTKKVSDAYVLIPIINPDNITPHAESFQSIICHLITNALGLSREHLISSTQDIV